MGIDLTQRMADWREGLISNAEILQYLLEAQAEVVMSIKDAETIKADQRMKRIGVPPFSAT